MKFLNQIDGADKVVEDASHRFVTDTEKTTWNGKQSAITGGATTIASSNLTASRALVSDSSGKVAVSSATSTELGYVSGVTSSIQTQLNGKAPTSHSHSDYAPMAQYSATLPATAGWYRIATSSAGINRCSARFEIDWALSGNHGAVIMNAGIMYGADPTINQIQYIRYTANGLTKARVVYHTAYNGNYAYLEVYNNTNSALVVNVQMLSSLGWSAVTPSTVGSIPVGYTSLELDFVDGIATEGILKSGVPTGTAPLEIASTTVVPNLNVDMIDGKHATDFALATQVLTNVPAGAVFTDTVYTHPANHPPSIITQDASNRFVTDTEKATWNAKGSSDLALGTTSTTAYRGDYGNTAYTHSQAAHAPSNANYYVHPTGDGNLHVPATGTTNNGKVLKAGATAGSLVWGVDNDTIYTHPANHPASIITQDASNRFVTDTEKSTWNGKQAAITGGATTIASSNLTASRALASDASGKVAVSTATSTELGYLSGVTSAVQTQLNGKSATSHNHTLDALSNTTITSNTYGEILKWNGSAWINNTLAEAGIAPTSHTHTISNITSLQSSLDAKFDKTGGVLNGTLMLGAGNGIYITEIGYTETPRSIASIVGNEIHLGDGANTNKILSYSNPKVQVTGSVNTYDHLILGGGGISQQQLEVFFENAPQEGIADIYNVLTNVDQNKSVIESGTNANGRYVKLGDGTMICWHTTSFSSTVNLAWGSLYYHSSQSWTFPVAFVGSKPVCNATCVDSGAELIGVVPYSTLTNLTYYGLRPAAVGSAVTISFRLMAIGRWKA